MRQSRAGKGEKQEDQNQRQSNAQDESLHGFFDVDSLFENCNDCDNGQYEIDWIVVEKFARQFGAESAEIDGSAAYPVAMETEADEVVFQVPVKNWDTTNCRNQQREVKKWIFQLFSVENQDVESHTDPKEDTGILGKHSQACEESE